MQRMGQKYVYTEFFFVTYRHIQCVLWFSTNAKYVKEKWKINNKKKEIEFHTNKKIFHQK